MAFVILATPKTHNIGELEQEVIGDFPDRLTASQWQAGLAEGNRFWTYKVLPKRDPVLADARLTRR